MAVKKKGKNRDGSLAAEPPVGVPDESAGGDGYNAREGIAPPPKPMRQDRPDNLAAPQPPSSIRETAAWQASRKGIGRMWANYKTILRDAFNNMSRDDQEALIQKLCVIVTLGVGCLGLLLFYPLLPRLGRVFGVPAALFGAYWAGNNLVTPVVLARVDHLLAKRE